MQCRVRDKSPGRESRSFEAAGQSDPDTEARDQQAQGQLGRVWYLSRISLLTIAGIMASTTGSKPSRPLILVMTHTFSRGLEKHSNARPKHLKRNPKNIKDPQIFIL